MTRVVIPLAYRARIFSSIPASRTCRLATSEGAKFWLAVLTELRQRGAQDIYIASMDGLTGRPEAVNTVFPETLTQLCMVHLAKWGTVVRLWRGN